MVRTINKPIQKNVELKLSINHDNTNKTARI